MWGLLIRFETSSWNDFLKDEFFADECLQKFTIKSTNFPGIVSFHDAIPSFLEVISHPVEGIA